MWPVFAKAGRPVIGCNISRKPWEIHPDFHGSDIESVVVLVGPSIAGLTVEERGGQSWPVRYTGVIGKAVAVPAEEVECMRGMAALGLFDRMSEWEIEAVREYVRSIPRVLKGRTRTCFWVTPLLQVTRVQFDVRFYARQGTGLPSSVQL